MPTTRLTPSGYGSTKENASYRPAAGTNGNKRSVPFVEARTSLPRAKKIRAQYLYTLPSIDVEMEDASPADTSSFDASNGPDQAETAMIDQGDNKPSPRLNARRPLSTRLMARAGLSMAPTLPSPPAGSSPSASPGPIQGKLFLHNIVA